MAVPTVPYHRHTYIKNTIMTYIDYLNAFNTWTESNRLPGSAKLMYYGLLHIFNKARWPDEVQVDFQRMMILLDTTSKATAVRARDCLAREGIIRYEKGRKGEPNRYRLCNLNETLNGTANETENRTLNETSNETANETHNKNKNKNKTDTPPLSPGGSVGHKKNPAGQDMPYGAELCRSYIPSSRKSSWSSRRSKVRVTLNRSPSISMAIFPPCSSASDFAMLRPRPLPSV